LNDVGENQAKNQIQADETAQKIQNQLQIETPVQVGPFCPLSQLSL
jgi:hypothetical protein